MANNRVFLNYSNTIMVLENDNTECVEIYTRPFENFELVEKLDYMELMSGEELTPQEIIESFNDIVERSFLFKFEKKETKREFLESDFFKEYTQEYEEWQKQKEMESD